MTSQRLPTQPTQIDKSSEQRIQISPLHPPTEANALLEIALKKNEANNVV